MPVDGSESLFLDRRTSARVDFRSVVRFLPDVTRPLRMKQALTQNLSLRGAQLLSSVLPDRSRPFPVWIPLENFEVVEAMAEVAWITVEDTLGDSPYWIRTGLQFSFARGDDRTNFLAELARRANKLSIEQQQLQSKVGYVF